MMDAVTGKTAATHALEENAKLMIRAMIQAAKADGEIDAEEWDRIQARLGDLEPEEKAFVEAEMAKPVDIGARAGHGRCDEGAGLCHVADGDPRRHRIRGRLSRRSGAALGLSDETRARSTVDGPRLRERA
jgi:hypothetical protein